MSEHWDREKFMVYHWWVASMPKWPTPGDYPNRDYLNDVLPQHTAELEQWESENPDA